MLSIISALISCGNSEHRQYQGYVEGLNIYLASPYSGNLMEALVQRGQHVQKGDLLFVLDPNPQAILIEQVTAGLEQAEHKYMDLKKPRRPAEIESIEAQIGQTASKIALAELRVKRNQVLYEKHSLPKDSLDASVEHLRELTYVKAQFEANLALAKEGSRESQIKSQEAAIAGVRSKLNQAKWELSQKSFHAPAEGVIFDTYFRQGEFVGVQQPVAALLTPENIRIEFFVPAEGLSNLMVGNAVTFDCDGCEKNNKALVQYISPEAEYVPPLVYSRDNRDKLVFRVKAAIHDSARFKPGQPVMVTVPKND